MCSFLNDYRAAIPRSWIAFSAFSLIVVSCGDARSGNVQVDALDAGDVDIKVDYSQSLEEMISAGDYDYTDSVTEGVTMMPDGMIETALETFFTPERITVNGSGSVERSVQVFHLDRPLSSEDVIKEMKAHGYVPANFEELVAFGAEQPDLQRKVSIYALGGEYFRGSPEVGKVRIAPGLTHRGEPSRDLEPLFPLRGIESLDWGGTWSKNARFLGVRWN